MPGHLLASRYEIGQRLGQGSVGVVYAAHDQQADRRVALKLIHRHLATRKSVIRRFRREVQTTASIEHVGVTKIYDFGVLSDGSPYLVMELFGGENLETRMLRKHRLAIPEACAIGCQLLSALSAVHAQEILHRDIKPSNIFISKSQNSGLTVRLLDFGMSKWLDAERTLVTTRGKVIGTPLYIAPEHVRGSEVDHRADLYSVGAVLYEMLTGEVPIHSDERNIARFLMRVLETAPRSLRHARPEVPEQLDRIVLKALAKYPDERFESAATMMEALQSVPMS